MRIRFWKPLHGWRQFAGEVAIIVIGILLALSAESWMDQRHWRQQAQLASEAIKEELSLAALWSYERQVIQPCLQGQISKLVGQLQRGGGRWSAAPMYMRKNARPDVLPFAYRGPSRVVALDAWQNAIASGSLNHLPRERVEALSALYNQIAHWRELQEAESSAAARLAPLAFNGQMDNRDRADMIAAVAEVDRINGLMTLISGQIVEALAALKLDYPKADVRKAAREVVSSQRINRGTCVVELPLDLA